MDMREKCNDVVGYTNFRCDVENIEVGKEEFHISDAC